MFTNIKIPQTSEEFNALVTSIEAIEGYRRPIGFAIGRADLGELNKDKVLQMSFPVVNWGNNFGSAAIFTAALQASGVEVNSTGSEFVADVNSNFIEVALKMFVPYLDEAKGNEHKNVQILKHIKAEILRTINNSPKAVCIEFTTKPSDNEEFVKGMQKEVDEKLQKYKIVFLYEDAPVESVETAYLKLYALSLGKVPIRSLNLNGVFGILPNVAWSGNIPYELDWLRENEISLKLDNDYPNIDSVDKFPRYLQHIIPADNTRILEASKVRMGAQLAAGTTVMPGASYINFNAGTLGPVMVEGRISSSAIVGAGSDIGGGASILGVLSGTDGNPISIGENCLLGANSVTGIPLGDACIVDAGVTILAGTKVLMDEDEKAKISLINPTWVPMQVDLCNGSDLQGLNGLHFRQDSTTGEMIVRRSTREVVLNEDLH